MMGAGKTTLGRALARRLGREFVDCDRVLVERTGVPVATIFEIEGEEGFRRRESGVLQELCARDRCVIATGGGVVLSDANRDIMRTSGTVVYLKARLESLWERTRHDASRPLLATPDPRARLAELLEEREPLYRQAAHVVVETGQQSPATAVGRVLAALRDHEGAGGAR
jgi:shikimate kinase